MFRASDCFECDGAGRRSVCVECDGYEFVDRGLPCACHFGEPTKTEVRECPYCGGTGTVGYESTPDEGEHFDEFGEYIGDIVDGVFYPATGLYVHLWWWTWLTTDERSAR